MYAWLNFVFPLPLIKGACLALALNLYIFSYDGTYVSSPNLAVLFLWFKIFDSYISVNVSFPY